MLNVSKMIESARECLGWPYVSPGSNDQNGIDCSGLFVKIFRDQNASITHGSNTIARKHCDTVSRIENVNDLQPGYAVFKWKEQDTEKYPDGRGDFCHIGLVISVNPLEIIHASSEFKYVVIDQKIGKWKYWGALKYVDYANTPQPAPAPEPTPTPEPEPTPTPEPSRKVYATVYSQNGKPVKMRYKPTTNCNLYDELRVGTRVEVTGSAGEWSCVNANGRAGWWMMSKFLQSEDGNVLAPAETEEPRVVTVTIEYLTEKEADELIAKYPNARKTYG